MNKSTVKLRFRNVVAVLLFAGSAAYGAGYEFEGVGARQVARGGAAVADARDWTALYWNPGLIAPVASEGVDVGLEFFGGEAYTRDGNSLSSLPGLTGFQKGKDHSKSFLGALGAVFPIGSKWGGALGFYTPLLQGADFQNGNSSGQFVDLENSAGILVWNASLGRKITDRFSAGAGVNVLYGKLKTDLAVQNFLVAGNNTTNDTEGDGWGLEGIFGLSFQATPSLAFGAVYRTGSDVELKGEADVQNSSVFIPDEKSDFKFDLRHPPTLGIGSAWIPCQKWSLTLDFNRTFWNRFTNQIIYDSPGTLLVNGGNGFNWRDSWKIRTGARYFWTEKTELIFGYSYDHPAIDGSSIDFATAIDVPMHRFSAGWARDWTRRFESVLGVVGGAGTRNEGGVSYRLSGYQVMLEGRFKFDR